MQTIHNQTVIFDGKEYHRAIHHAMLLDGQWKGTVTIQKKTFVVIERDGVWYPKVGPYWV